MNTKILPLTGLASVGFACFLASSAQGAVTATLTETQIQALDGETSYDFDQTFLDTDSGISVTLNFEFTATGGAFNTDTATGNRLGIDGATDEGGVLSAGVSAFDSDELLTLNVSLVSSTSTLATLDFGVSNIDIYRSSNTPGAVSYLWASSNGNVQIDNTSEVGAAAPDVGDVSSDYNLLSGPNYTATFTEIDDDIALENAPRFGTDGISITLSATAAVPEPSSAALLGLGGLAFILRRRRA